MSLKRALQLATCSLVSRIQNFPKAQTMEKNMPLINSHEQIPTWWWQPNFRAFRDAIAGDRSLLLFVGSGLSVGAGLPNWPGLLLKLAGLYDDKYPDVVPQRHLLDEVQAMLTANR